MIVGASLSLAAMALQSGGKVLYGSFLAGVATPWFILISVCLCAAVFRWVSRAAVLPRAPGLLLLANLWTAIGFIGLFYALKHLPPAVFAAIEIGVSLLAALALTSMQRREWPSLARSLTCAGILAGCVVLAFDEVESSLGEGSALLAVSALAVSAAVGISSALSTVACKRLAAHGWSSASVLTHRFYLTIAAVGVWLLLPGVSSGPALGEDATIGMASLIVVTAMLIILVPALLFQMALRHTDALTVLICMAAQPAMSFLLSLASPAYDWSFIAFVGVSIVTSFVALDIYLNRRAKLLPNTGTAFGKS